MLRYLILEDNDEFFNQTYLKRNMDLKGQEGEFTYQHVRTAEEAKEALAVGRFSAAILDLRLNEATEQAEGNIIARQIHRDYLIPIAIVSGHVDELAPEFQTLASSNSSFLRVFNKNQGLAPVFDFLLKTQQSGVIQMLGPGGELNQIMSDIFWKHLGAVVHRWSGKSMSVSERKRVLRHAVSHMVGALQSNESGDWDNFLPEEIYIWPRICEREMPGHIYRGKEKAEEFYLLVTPFCDFKKISLRHFVKILPFSDFRSNSKVEGILAKKEHRFHLLPPTSFFNGGIVDFAEIKTIDKVSVEKQFECEGSLIEPYWREIVNRLGAWLGRQGTPDFDGKGVLALIQAQGAAPQSLAAVSE